MEIYRDGLVHLLASSISYTFPMILINVFGITLVLMNLGPFPRARRFGIIGCVLGIISPIASLLFRWAMPSLYYDALRGQPSVYSLYIFTIATGLFGIASAICWFIAATADRSTDYTTDLDEDR